MRWLIGFGLFLVALFAAWHFAADDRAQFWLGFLTGNWFPPAQGSPVTPFEFALTGCLAIVLNLSPILAAWALIQGWVKPVFKENAGLKQAFTVFANNAKFEVDRRFVGDSGAEAKIDEAFKTAKEAWGQSLIAALGEAEAKKLMHEIGISAA
jgi:hypothetical protein